MKTLMISAVALTAMAAAAAAEPVKLTDAQMDRIAGGQDGRSDISQGQRLTNQGNQDIRQGQASIQEGRADISQGQRLTNQGNQDIRQGLRLINEGNRDIRQGQRL